MRERQDNSGKQIYWYTFNSWATGLELSRIMSDSKELSHSSEVASHLGSQAFFQYFMESEI
jgi:hypothetical protein